MNEGLWTQLLTFTLRHKNAQDNHKISLPESYIHRRRNYL